MVLVVGRESNVRGLAFYNSEIIKKCLMFFPDMTIIGVHERKFTSRYGSVVYEDIFAVEKSSVSNINTPNLNSLLSNARVVAKEQLERNLSRSTGEIYDDLLEALEKLASVTPSPVIEIDKQ